MLERFINVQIVAIDVVENWWQMDTRRLDGAVNEWPLACERSRRQIYMYVRLHGSSVFAWNPRLQIQLNFVLIENCTIIIVPLQIFLIHFQIHPFNFPYFKFHIIDIFK